jgi:hypothetical protein
MNTRAGIRKEKKQKQKDKKRKKKKEKGAWTEERTSP